MSAPGVNRPVSDACHVVPQGSAGCPSVLDSSQISTENGRTSRFPRPELEISFSPLQPNRMALRRQGEESAVTVKITRSARKRKSGEMDKVRTRGTSPADPFCCFTSVCKSAHAHVCTEETRWVLVLLAPVCGPRGRGCGSVLVLCWFWFILSAM